MAIPTRSCYDSRFRYTPSSKTDIRKTFARVRKEMVEKEKVYPVLQIRRAK